MFLDEFFANSGVSNGELNDAYGVCYDLDTGTFTRLGTLIDYSATYSNKPFSNVPDLLLPIQRNMRRCLLLDSVTVNYYLDATDSTKKANGEAAVLDGTDGQVMVEIPAHWWKYERIGNKLYWWNAPTEKTGYGWKYSPKSYIAAYEGQLYDHSAGSIVGGQGGADTANDKLCSVSGVEAHTDETIVEYRALSTNRGAGWFQQANHIYAAVARLSLIEYASFDTQTKISEGLTNASSSDWSAYNGYCPLHAAGITNSLGNASGEVALEIENFVGGTGTLSTQVMSYRGVENWYGHIWKWLDGANVNNVLTENVASISKAVVGGDAKTITVTTSAAHGRETGDYVVISGVVGLTDINKLHVITKIDATSFTVTLSSATSQTYTSGGSVWIGESRLYLCDNPEKFASNVVTDYELVGYLPPINSYYDIASLEKGFYPALPAKGSTTGLCDYFYTYYPTEGWRVVAVGGRAYYGVKAGAFCVSSNYDSSGDASYFGGRLCAAAGE